MTAKIHWNEDGLVPAVIQDAVGGRVLMLGWMNEEALTRTIESGRVHFWSRSRKTLWKKGETSGNELHLRSLSVDCDGDALLVHADPAGPTCHTGQTSCFFEPLTEGRSTSDDGRPAELGPALTALTEIVRERAASRPEGSLYRSPLAGRYPAHRPKGGGGRRRGGAGCRGRIHRGSRERVGRPSLPPARAARGSRNRRPECGGGNHPPVSLARPLTKSGPVT